MRAPVHGGDIYSYVEAHQGRFPLDLSTNVNPYGMPAAVRQALQDAIPRCGAYPDPLCRAARRAISEREHVPPDWIYCGNGAADVLDRLATALHPRRVLLLAPTFAEYERSLCQTQTGQPFPHPPAPPAVPSSPPLVTFHWLRPEDDFAVTERLLAALTPGLDMVCLCNPNNPTGRTIAPLLLREIVARCAACDTWLLVDECFQDFLPDRAAHTLQGLLPTYPQLVLLRAYTKMYAMPGVRFGWCMSANTALTTALYTAGQPWNVSVLAQAGAVAAAAEPAFAEKSARRIAAERQWLYHELARRGGTVYPGEANFLLWNTGDPTLCARLAQRGILLRDCSQDRGLGPGYVRTAVKTHEDSLALLAALDAVRG